MKRIFTSIVSGAFLAAAGSVSCVAQDYTTSSQDQASEIESLRQEVADLREAEAQRELDERIKGVFKRTKFFNIGYVNSTLTPESEPAMKCNYGFSMTLGNRYFLHKKPIANMIKIGLDALWFDATYVNLKTVADVDDYTYDYGQGSGSYYPDYWDDDDDPFSELNIGSHQIDLGIGLGPSVTIAPFATRDNGLRFLRASLWFHCTPSFSMVLMDQGDGYKFNYAFVPFLNFGGSIQWKAISFWIEGRWGSANYHLAETEDMEDFDGNYVAVDKWSMKTKSLRVGIGLNF